MRAVQFPALRRHLSEASLRTELTSGRLAPALPQWRSKDAPLGNLFYRSNGRQVARVRAFIDFAAELFQRPDQARSVSAAIADRPAWYHRAGRASAGRRR